MIASSPDVIELRQENKRVEAEMMASWVLKALSVWDWGCRCYHSTLNGFRLLET